MKVTNIYSGMIERRGQGSRPYVSITLTPDTEEEKAILRLSKAGNREVHIYDSGMAEIQITMPRGK